MRGEEEENYNPMAEYQRKLKLKLFWLSILLVLFYCMLEVLPKILHGREEFVVYDEKSNTLYVTDEATYNKWISRNKHMGTEFKKARPNDYLYRDGPYR